MSRPDGPCRDIVGVVHTDHVLLDDRTGIEFGGHVVAGGADQLHAAGERLVIGAGTDERRQEAVVNVDRAPGPVLAQ